MDELLDSIYNDDYEDDYSELEFTPTVKRESLKVSEDYHKPVMSKHKKPIRIDKRAMEYSYD